MSAIEDYPEGTRVRVLKTGAAGADVERGDLGTVTGPSPLNPEGWVFVKMDEPRSPGPGAQGEYHFQPVRDFERYVGYRKGDRIRVTETRVTEAIVERDGPPDSDGDLMVNGGVYLTVAPPAIPEDVTGPYVTVSTFHVEELGNEKVTELKSKLRQAINEVVGTARLDNADSERVAAVLLDLGVKPA